MSVELQIRDALIDGGPTQTGRLLNVAAADELCRHSSTSLVVCCYNQDRQRTTPVIRSVLGPNGHFVAQWSFSSLCLLVDPADSAEDHRVDVDFYFRGYLVVTSSQFFLKERPSVS